MKRQLTGLVSIVLCIQLIFASSAQSASKEPGRVKELNFVFLHGAGGHACSLQPLADSIMAQIPECILEYEEANPDIKISIDTLARCYPNNVDIYTWANNIADSIDKHFNKKNLVLIGHSMGGKAALYAVAHNVGNLADKVAMVITINSPIKNLSQYYFPAGTDYWQALWLLPSDQGVLGSAAYYDSAQDGYWVGSQKHWLAFISSESAPTSNQFDVSGVDPWPRDMDDKLIPISAQYSDGADVVYYGDYGHSDFAIIDSVTNSMASQILRYIFGGTVECAVFARGATFEHKASWLPVTNTWKDIVSELPAAGDLLTHKNESFTKWQVWEDIVGQSPSGAERGSYKTRLVSSFPFLTSILEARWLDADNPENCLLYIRTKAAPRSTVKVAWSVSLKGGLPPQVERDHYETRIVTGTPFTEVEKISWLTDNPQDLRLQILSHAEGPFRWFKVDWRVYLKESRVRKVIDELPSEAF
jgi:pimeloyl-ACP methyl ester carboxylesterase